MTNGIDLAPVAPHPRRALLAACTAHWLHDGYLDLTYVLLPIWQAHFGLDYAALAMIRGTYAGTMALAQVPVDRRLAGLGSRRSLALGTLVAAAGFVLVGVSSGAVLLCAALVVAGLGSSTQHPRGSVIVTETYGGAARGPLGIYNFAGDLGKATFPALTSLMLLALTWRHAVFVLAAIGALVAALLAAPHDDPVARGDTPAPVEAAAARPGLGADFATLFVIGMLDTAPRMGFLLLLPFVLGGLHAAPSTVGIGLALVFAGGAFGKFACGWIGSRLGLVGTIAATEGMTAVMILAVPFLPLPGLLALLPLLGVALNGTSTVLYGTVPETARGDIGHAFALFYTGVIGAGALAPIGFGALADAAGRPAGLVAVALTALATIPLALILAKQLSGHATLPSDAASSI